MASNRLKTLGYIEALCKDAFGNGLTGNPERSLRFLREAINIIRLLKKFEETHHPKDGKAIEEAMREMLEAELTWPKHVMNPETMKQYMELGLLENSDTGAEMLPMPKVLTNIFESNTITGLEQKR